MFTRKRSKDDAGIFQQSKRARSKSILEPEDTSEEDIETMQTCSWISLQPRSIDRLLTKSRSILDPEDTSEEDIETVETCSSWGQLLGCAPLAEQLASTAALDGGDKKDNSIKRQRRDAPVAQIVEHRVRKQNNTMHHIGRIFNYGFRTRCFDSNLHQPSV